MSSVLEMEKKVVGRGTQPPPTDNDGAVTERKGKDGSVRLNATLIRRAADALARAARREGSSKGNIVNRALQLYDEFSGMRDNGWEFQARNPNTGEVERIKIF